MRIFELIRVMSSGVWEAIKVIDISDLRIRKWVDGCELILEICRMYLQKCDGQDWFNTKHSLSGSVVYWFGKSKIDLN